MKIAIDVSQVVYGTGVSEYTKNLVSNILLTDRISEYVLFGLTLRRGGDLLKIFPNAKIFPIPPSLTNILWNKLHIMPSEKLIGKVDILHTSDWAEPPSSSKKITTVHDLAPLLFPGLFPKDVIRDIVSTHRTKLAWVKEESSRIIVPTNATKNDLEKLGFDSAKIRIIPEAADTIFYRRNDEQVRKIKRKFGIHEKYILGVGMDPRKNTANIIKAFEQAKAGKDIKLVLVGQSKYYKVAQGRDVRILGHVSKEELATLYSGAEALIYASLYEGFGLPILEAMACGCPVVTSNLSSMAEVAGKAAILVDPSDTDSIREGLEKVIRGAKIFVQRGYRRSAEFTWKSAAEKTIAVYNELK